MFTLHLTRSVALRAEVLFLRQQLALYAARDAQPRRARRRERVSLAICGRFFPWREALLVVQPATFIRWQRELVSLVWRWKSRPGRPAIPHDLRQLVCRMALDNPLWGEERIADELLVKLGIRISARTIRKYMPRRPRGSRTRDQRWQTFIRNHAKTIVACDFVVSMTVGFQVIYTLVVMEIGSRRLLHVATTAHPTAAWTTQQLREGIPAESGHRYLLHDRDAIFSADLDEAMKGLGLTILKSPPRSPKANAVCERLIGSLRRECLDHIIPLSERHIAMITREWMEHYNQGRPHFLAWAERPGAEG